MADSTRSCCNFVVIVVGNIMRKRFNIKNSKCILMILCMLLILPNIGLSLDKQYKLAPKTLVSGDKEISQNLVFSYFLKKFTDFEETQEANNIASIEEYAEKVKNDVSGNWFDIEALYGKGEVIIDFGDIKIRYYNPKRQQALTPSVVEISDRLSRELIGYKPKKENVELLENLKKLRQKDLNGDFSKFVEWIDSILEQSNRILSKKEILELGNNLNISTKDMEKASRRFKGVAENTYEFVKSIPNDGKYNIYLFRDSYSLYLTERVLNGNPRAFYLSKASFDALFKKKSKLTEKRNGHILPSMIIEIAKKEMGLNMGESIPKGRFWEFKKIYFKIVESILFDPEYGFFKKEDLAKTAFKIISYFGSQMPEGFMEKGCRFIDTKIIGSFTLFMEGTMRAYMKKAGKDKSTINDKLDSKMLYSELSEEYTFLETIQQADKIEGHDFPVKFGGVKWEDDMPSEIVFKENPNEDKDKFLFGIILLKNELMLKKMKEEVAKKNTRKNIENNELKIDQTRPYNSQQIISNIEYVAPALLDTLALASEQGKKIIIALDENLSRGPAKKAIVELIDLIERLRYHDDYWKENIKNIEIIRGDSKNIARKLNNIKSVEMENVLLFANNIDRGEYGEFEGVANITYIDDSLFEGEIEYVPLLEAMLFSLSRYLYGEKGRSTISSYYSKIPNADPLGRFSREYRNKLLDPQFFEKTIVIRLIPKAVRFDSEGEFRETMDGIKTILSNA